MANLIGGDWIRQAQNLILTGATGCGKTWLACVGQSGVQTGNVCAVRSNVTFPGRNETGTQRWQLLQTADANSQG